MITIVAGVGKNENIVEAARIVQAENSNINIVLIKSEKEFLKLFLEKKADAYIRGSLSAAMLMKHLRQNYQINESYNDQSTFFNQQKNTIMIHRAAYLQLDNHRFLLAPVGIDEGSNIQEKLSLVDDAASFLKKMEIEPKIGVLSGGRPQDKGRSSQIDKSIEDGEKLTSIIKHKYSVNHYYILIENAINDGCNLILAPDGISGNLIFRSLVLVGSVESYGAITLGIDQILIDTSRAQSVEGYIRALNFSYYLSKLKI
jgi:putative methanogen marker protein 4